MTTNRISRPEFYKRLKSLPMADGVRSGWINYIYADVRDLEPTPVKVLEEIRCRRELVVCDDSGLKMLVSILSIFRTSDEAKAAFKGVRGPLMTH